MRVMMTDWLMPGKVYSAFRAAAAPQNELTPGTTSKAMFFSATDVHLFANGPVDRRILPCADGPSSSQFFGRSMAAMTSSKVMDALSKMTQSFLT